ncbi:SEC-C domain-containing protein [Candidatus Dojkabacteria bacterium]|nr:SEC-C domain-containing protein [Candidatus Dojkabacteria bacterium]
MINNVIINNSYKKAICSQKDYLESLLSEYQFESPSQIYIGHTSGDHSGFIKKKEVFFDSFDTAAYFLLNQPYLIEKLKETGRNDQCPCNSGKKYKKCHEPIFERVKVPYYYICNQHLIKPGMYQIPEVAVIEEPIDSWGPWS